MGRHYWLCLLILQSVTTHLGDCEFDNVHDILFDNVRLEVLSKNDANRVVVTNAGFEEDCSPLDNTKSYPYFCYVDVDDGPIGWEIYNPRRINAAHNYHNFGIVNPSQIKEYMNGVGATEGSQSLFTAIHPQDFDRGEYGVQQTVNAFVAAQTTYILKVDICNPLRWNALQANLSGSPQARIDLLADDHILAQRNVFSLSDETWTTATIEYTAPDHTPYKHHPLTIRLVDLNHLPIAAATGIHTEARNLLRVPIQPNPRCDPTPTTTTTPYPTKRPTPNPTKRPTPNPTKRPTNPGGVYSCGDTVSGSYHGDPVTIIADLPYEGDLQFDASASTFVVTDIEAFTALNMPLGTDTDNDGKVTLFDKPAGRYKFIMLGSDATIGTFQANLNCFSADPTSNPTKRPTQNPVIVTVPTTPNPTKKPTPNPTKRPTDPPTTARPTSNPSVRPTTAHPTQPGAMACGDAKVDVYPGGQLIFETSIPFEGELTFDASGSNFNVIAIEALTKLGSILGSDTDGDSVVSVDVPAGQYQFVMQGASSGLYHVTIRCVSDAPTRSPSDNPTTQRPSQDPSRDPSESRIAATTPSKGPTTRPTDPTPKPTRSPIVTTSDANSNEQTDEGELRGASPEISITDSAWLRTAVYILLGIIIVFGLYKYCYAYRKRMDNIEHEMAKLEHVSSTGSTTVPKDEKDFERDLVISWLRYTVQLPEYTDNFLNNGYENMRAIQTIACKEEVASLGINPPGHQALILAEIKGIQGTKLGTRSKREGGGPPAGSGFAALPPQPLQPVSTLPGLPDQPKVLGTDGAYYGNGEGGRDRAQTNDSYDSNEDLFDTTCQTSSGFDNIDNNAQTHAQGMVMIAPTMRTPPPPPRMMSGMNMTVPASHVAVYMDEDEQYEYYDENVPMDNMITDEGGL
eukprot:31880_1